MTSSIVTIPAGPASPPGSVVEGDGWYPPIDVNLVRDQWRVNSVVPDARLREALITAAIDVQIELAPWRALREAEGHIALDDVPAPQINFESAFLSLYRRAVAASAMADLVDTYREITATNEGQLRADEIEKPSDDYRRMATHAVRRILGKTRTTVGLL